MNAWLYSVILETGSKIRLSNQDILLIWLGALIGVIASKLLDETLKSPPKPPLWVPIKYRDLYTSIMTFVVWVLEVLLFMGIILFVLSKIGFFELPS